MRIDRPGPLRLEEGTQADAIDRPRRGSPAVPARSGAREFLRVGLAGFGSLSLPGLFHLRARAASAPARPKTALIVVWLHGGASHLESFDPKPDAPSEYRGPYQPIATRVPGLQFCELFPAWPISPTGSPSCGPSSTPGSATTTARSRSSRATRSRAGGSSRRIPTSSRSPIISAKTRRERCRITWGSTRSPTSARHTWGPRTTRSRSTAIRTRPPSRSRTWARCPRGRPNGSAGASACGRASTASARTSTGRGTCRPSTPSRSRRGTC